MKIKELKASKRDVVNKVATKALRNEGRVPGVVYGIGDPIPISMDPKDLKDIIYTADNYLLKVDVDGDQFEAIIRETQFDPLTEKLLHVDLYRLKEGLPVTLSLPIVLTGKPKGVDEGGRLMSKLRQIKVKGVPADLPSEIEIDVTELGLGQSIKIRDAVIEGFEVVSSLALAVASVDVPRAMRSAGLDEAEGEELAEGEEGEETEGGEEEAAE